MQKQNYTAALIIIGNEILSGRTQDKNTAFLAETLGRHGISLHEVRIIPDIEAKIIETVNVMRAEADYVFTTGGIGPTHDDITAESIAKAFGVAWELNDEAYQMLVAHYRDEAEVTEARKKMAMIPAGAALIDNPVSGAPGFILENVHVMAGVPRIMQAMTENVVPNLSGGAVVQSQTITCQMAESELSAGLADIQNRFSDLDIGSYPNYHGSVGGLSVVIRSTDVDQIRAAGKEVITLMQSMGQEPTAVTAI